MKVWYIGIGINMVKSRWNLKKLKLEKLKNIIGL